MNTLLDALQEGRLIELPDNNKDDALQFLAHIIEAIPSVRSGTDVVGLVTAREATVNTALSKGWAVPHARISGEGDLICVIGWSPVGIDYGAPGGTPVSIIAMFLVPDDQRNHYLREVSTLARALTTYAEMDKLCAAAELNDVRDILLDLISATSEAAGPDTRARMIQLQTKATVETAPVRDLSRFVIEPVTLVASPGSKSVVLTQNHELTVSLDNAQGLIEGIANNGIYQNGGWRVVKRGEMVYQADRIIYDCLAIKDMT
ncbi:MAG: PTS sugar transporter subunit IIA [Syntrophobacterales bacterium]|jgi:mannitol/fructose-specific phosphotransferase system IIA component (Ntr-type)|nr:PTS sugar transporter subunit IIA [Syntrophobacterales bacterium]